jgi:uncharacterized protein YegL
MSTASVATPPPVLLALPVIVLADASGSMSAEDKINVLNESIEQMARDFAAQEQSGEEIQIAVIAFGGEAARLVHAPTAAAALAWQPLQAAGRTPLGGALALVRKLLEDPSQIPHDAFRPTLVLVSDGLPTDAWRPELQALLSCERAAQAFRIAIAIGADADRAMLRAFVGRTGPRVLEAHEAADIAEYLRRITMAVSRAAACGGYQTLDALELGPPPNLDTLDG